MMLIGVLGSSTKVCRRIVKNGEPGFAWLGNMQGYGRMGDAKNNRDAKAMGGNPCLEQTLESFEMCCLVETFPYKHGTLEDYLETLRQAEACPCAGNVVPKPLQDSMRSIMYQRTWTLYMNKEILLPFFRWCDGGPGYC